LDNTPKEQIPDIWYQVRKKVADIKNTLPQGVVGPYFNDEFGDVFGIIYAFTADGFTRRELRDYVENIRTEIFTVKNAAKVQLLGAQDQKFYLEFDNRQLAGLGVTHDQIIQTLREQNAVTPSGVVQTPQEKFAVRVSGSFNSIEDLKRINLFADQSVVVEEAVGGFTKALWEAIAIVLAVSFLSLGLRAGVVVACSIPLVLGMVFVYMEYSGISLQRISLGALIISLGLLVD